MDALAKLERTIEGWFKNVPHLPAVARGWIGQNVWWIILIGVILSGLAIVIGFIGLLGILSGVALFSAGSSFAAYVGWAVITALVSLVFSVAMLVFMAMAITPLREKQKKGWTLLFITWLVGILSVVVGAVLSLNVFSFIAGIIFGVIWVAVSGYFLFEIKGQFAISDKSKGVKAGKA